MEAASLKHVAKCLGRFDTVPKTVNGKVKGEHFLVMEGACSEWHGMTSKTACAQVPVVGRDACAACFTSMMCRVVVSLLVLMRPSDSLCSDVLGDFVLFELVILNVVQTL